MLLWETKHGKIFNKSSYLHLCRLFLHFVSVEFTFGTILDMLYPKNASCKTIHIDLKIQNSRTYVSVLIIHFVYKRTVFNMQCQSKNCCMVCMKCLCRSCLFFDHLKDGVTRSKFKYFDKMVTSSPK